MQSLFDKIPEYRAALALETEQRDAAFLQEANGKELIPIIVNRKWPRRPLKLRPISIRRMLILEHAKSPFVCGGKAAPTAGDIAVFLWVCSPGFCVDKNRRDKFIRSCRTVNASDALETIQRMVNAAFYDSPPREKSNGETASYWSMAASFIDCFAAEYGWPMDVTLDAPLAGILQLFKVIQHRRSASAGQSVPLFNPSDSIKSRWLEKVNAEGGNHGDN